MSWRKWRKRELIKDFLQALAACIKEQVGAEYGLYFGRLLQGARKPCLVLLPPEVSRRVLSGGRVQREYGVDLRFYPDGRLDLFEQQRIGEKLICALDELIGEDRNYRGRELRYAPRGEYLSISVKYDVITLRSLEREDGAAIDRNVMLEFGFTTVE